MTDKPDRLDLVDAAEFTTTSLVGSYVHSDADHGWQGVVVAEPVAGLYLVELFSWLGGGSTCQKLVPVETMVDWSFYDTAEWMKNESESMQTRWQKERLKERVRLADREPGRVR